MTASAVRKSWRAWSAAVVITVVASLLVTTSAAHADPPEVLFVAASGVGTVDDRLVVGVLVDAGFVVSVVDDDVVSAGSAGGFDVVLISGSAAPGKVGSAFTGVSVPVVNYERLLHDDLGLTAGGSSNRGEQGTFKAIDVVGSSHPIVGGAFSGSTEVFRKFSKVTWGVPSGDAVVVASQLNRADRAVLFTYESGDVLASGGVAAGRRAGVFLAPASDGLLNAVGEQLLVNTLLWATASTNSAPVVDAGPDMTVDASITSNLSGTFTDDQLPTDSQRTPQWSGPAGVVFGSPQSLDTTVTVPGPGIFELTLSVDDGLAIGTDTVTLTAVNLVPPTASGTIDVTSGSVPLLVNVDASSSVDGDGTITSYLWDFGDGASATTETASHIYTGAGTFPVNLTVTDDLGATDTVLVGTVETTGGTTGAWVDGERPYRIPITVDAGPVDRIDRPAVVAVDFGQALSNVGAAGSFAADSLHLVQRSGTSVVATAVPVQFDPASPGADSGTVLVQIDGTLPAGQTRTFELYFDVAGGGYSPIAVSPKVSLDQNSSDAGISSTYAVATEIGTYEFDPAGGGFSSLNDVDGADWVGYDANVAGSAGTFRGFPNMIHPEAQFRPGGTGVTTTVVGDGPLRTTMDVTADGGSWTGQWQIYPTFARFELSAVAHDFWFLYEGTPGGTLDAGDLYIRSDGSSVNALTDTVASDIAGPEWAMAADPAVGRAFFAAHDTDDGFADSYRALDGVMTVMTFGRDTGLSKLMSATPDGFTVGLVDATTAATAAPVIDSARLPLTGSAGPAELNQVDTTPPTISNIAATATETSATISWATSESADATVDFGLTSSYTDTVSESPRRIIHGIGIAGLSCATTYHFQVSSSDASANTASSGDQTFTTSVCGSDVLASLPLDEGSGITAADQGPNGNDGTLLNGAQFEATSGDGSPSAVRFDGVDDGISLGGLDVVGDQLTIAAWFNADAFTGANLDPRLVSKATGLPGADHLFLLSTIGVNDAPRLRGRIRIGGATTTLVASSGDISTGQWHHAAMTYDGSTVRLYLDGVEVGSTPLSGTIDVDPTVDVFIGSQPTGAGSRFFDGLIDDVRIVQRALSAAEVAALANP